MDSYSTYDSSGMSSYSSVDSSAAVGMAMGILLLYVVILVVAYVVCALLLGKIFKKANTPSWIAWVPIYNTWKMLEIGGQKAFWAILALVPLVNIVSAVFMIIAAYHIGKKLGKEDWFVVLYILLPLVWLIWLAVDSSTWDDSKGAPRTDTPVSPVAQAPMAAPVAPVVQQPEQSFGAPVAPAPQQPQAPAPTQDESNTPPQQTPPAGPLVQ